MLFTCIKSWFFRNHLANFHQISHWSFCWNAIDSLFKWSCSIDCQAHIFFFKTKNCSYDDIFISCDVRIGKMLHNICMSAVAMSLRWANHGLLFHIWHDDRYVWLGKLTALDMTPLGWLGCKNLNTNKQRNRSKFYSAILTALAHDLKIKVKNLEILY